MRSRLAGSCGRRQHPIKINVPSLVILARYGLDGRKDTQTVHSNALNEDTQDELGDPRLEKLWHKVPLAISPLLKLVLTCGELQCGTGMLCLCCQPCCLSCTSSGCWLRHDLCAYCPSREARAVLVGCSCSAELLPAVRTPVLDVIFTVCGCHTGVRSGSCVFFVWPVVLPLGLGKGHQLCADVGVGFLIL